jgi:RNA polymerase sigma factor (sigma-70 family)
MSNFRGDLTAEQHMQSAEYQERLARDIELTNRIKAGYTPAERSADNPNPRIIDGFIDEDAQVALGELFMHYERLVTKEARISAGKAHNNTSLSLEDLKNQGYFGIYHAAVTYNPDLGVSYTGHARRTIKHHLNYFAKQHESLIRLPSDIRDSVRRYGKAVWSTYQSQERFPARNQVAKMMGIDCGEAEMLALLEAKTVQMGSIDVGYFTDGRDRKTTLDAGEGKWSPIYPDAAAAREVDAEAITRVMQEVLQEVLAEREDMGYTAKLGAQVIRLRYFGTNENGWQPMPLEEVAKILNVIDSQQRSRERIRQIEARALAILRNPVFADRLRSCMETA